MQLPGTHSETLRIANDKVGLVIGKGGETIKGLQQQLGIRIQIEQPTGGPEREIIISGSLKGIESAKTGEDIAKRKQEIENDDSPHLDLPIHINKIRINNFNNNLNLNKYQRNIRWKIIRNITIGT